MTMTNSTLVLTCAIGRELFANIDCSWQTYGQNFYTRFDSSNKSSSQLLNQAKQLWTPQLSMGIKSTAFVPSVVFSDVDATLILSECIDLLAAACGQGAEVAKITHEAMNGESDFTDSLRKRVRMLKGLSQSDVERVAATIALQPNASEFITWCQQRGLDFFAISGGFTNLLEILAPEWGIDGFHANRLEFASDLCTGELIGSIVDGAEKKRWLIEQCNKKGLSVGAAVVLGDGANDLDMLKAAGLSIGFNPKPVLYPYLDVLNNTGDFNFHRNFIQLLGDDF